MEGRLDWGRGQRADGREQRETQWSTIVEQDRQEGPMMDRWMSLVTVTVGVPSLRPVRLHAGARRSPAWVAGPRIHRGTRIRRLGGHWGGPGRRDGRRVGKRGGQTYRPSPAGPQSYVAPTAIHSLPMLPPPSSNSHIHTSVLRAYCAPCWSGRASRKDLEFNTISARLPANLPTR